MRSAHPTLIPALVLCATVPLNAQTSASQPAQAPAGGPGEAFSSVLPGLDPSTGTARFNGQTWNINDNALFRARFEKYLSTPEETNAEESEHRRILNEIIVLLDPNNLKPQTLTDAYRLLARAATFRGDSRLCDTLSGAIYSVWQSKRNQTRLAEANRILGEEQALARKNMATTAGSDQIAASGRRPDSAQSGPSSSAIIQAGRAETIAANGVLIKANAAKGELSELQAKVQYQGLLVQLFLQKRFHHVVIGSRFYRALFNDGDSKLNLPESSQNPFSKGTGMPPTISTIESLANEAMREVQTNVQSFHRLYELHELRSASERLRDALMVGEFMPEVRTLPFERKRKVLTFIQNAARLQSAIESKDYTAALNLLDGPKGLEETATDFDAVKIRALIQTARTSARMLIAKARNAANFGDKDGFEAALKEAAAIWPNNPELQEAATKAFDKGDVLAQAQMEMDQLVAQKNIRKIAEDAGRFLAATQTSSPEKQAQLKQILDDFKVIESTLMAAREMDRQGNPAGAWETVSTVSERIPDDLPLSQAQAHYTTKAADFVRTMQTARDHDHREQAATSLAWYLKAQRLYPKSEIATKAIQRLQNTLLQTNSH